MDKTRPLFKQLENAPLKTQYKNLDEVITAIKWNTDGLLPAIAQDKDTKEVLMLAWMNKDALLETLETQQVCYWSRSRQKLWRKGETSGQMQSLVSMYLDCDGDTLLLEVKQLGAACHTGRRSCFYNALTNEGIEVCTSAIIDPKALYKNKPDKDKPEKKP